jgi:hypothetical protein
MDKPQNWKKPIQPLNLALAFGCLPRLLIALSASAFNWSLPRVEHYFKSHDPNYVTHEFVNALRTNNSVLINLLVASEQQARVETWLKSHASFDCPAPAIWEEDFWEPSAGESGGGGWVGSQWQKWEWGYRCYQPHYQLYVVGLLLKKEGAGWTIID